MTNSSKKSDSTGDSGRDYISNSLVALCALGVFGYVLWRAVTLSITHDEALTFFLHANLPVLDILTCSGSLKANNHLLNTLLVKLFTGLFGVSETAVRVSALVGCFLYASGTVMVLRKFPGGGCRVIGAVLLLANPFLLDFLSIGRGYALALGFTMWALYFMLERIRRPYLEAQLTSFLALLMTVLATLSSLPFLHVFLAFLVTIVLIEIVKFKTFLQNVGADPSGKTPNKADSGRVKIRPVGPVSFLRRLVLGIVPVSVALGLLYYQPIMAMMSTKELSFEGDAGLFSKTLGSLVLKSLYNQSYAESEMKLAISLLVVVLFIAGGLLLLKYVGRIVRFREINDVLIWLVLLISLCVASIVSQHYLLDVSYPWGRTALYFVPLFGVYLLSMYLHIRDRFGPLVRRIAGGVGVVAAGAMLLNLWNSANVSYFLIWKYDSQLKQGMQMIDDWTRDLNIPPRALAIGISWRLEPGINFYILKNDLSWVRWVHRSSSKLDKRNHIYYFMESDKKEMKNRKDVVIAKNFPLSKTYIGVDKRVMRRIDFSKN